MTIKVLSVELLTFSTSFTASGKNRLRLCHMTVPMTEMLSTSVLRSLLMRRLLLLVPLLAMVTGTMPELLTSTSWVAVAGVCRRSSLLTMACQVTSLAGILHCTRILWLSELGVSRARRSQRETKDPVDTVDCSLVKVLTTALRVRTVDLILPPIANSTTATTTTEVLAQELLTSSPALEILGTRSLSFFPTLLKLMMPLDLLLTFMRMCFSSELTRPMASTRTPVLPTSTLLPP
mmetsp:Transcript_26349/g.44482  ORF Transcript_26349/g.44482 Transcript_26349/m.44482 type:complete len:235 (-) Transcript_26349:661-1365(-)